MKCICGTSICYICRTKLTVSGGYHNHFCSIPHCNHSTCGNCVLFTDSVQDDARAVEEAAIHEFGKVIEKDASMATNLNLASILDTVERGGTQTRTRAGLGFQQHARRRQDINILQQTQREENHANHNGPRHVNAHAQWTWGRERATAREDNRVGHRRFEHERWGHYDDGQTYQKGYNPNIYGRAVQNAKRFHNNSNNNNNNNNNHNHNYNLDRPRWEGKRLDRDYNEINTWKFQNNGPNNNIAWGQREYNFEFAWAIVPPQTGWIPRKTVEDNPWFKNIGNGNEEIIWRRVVVQKPQNPWQRCQDHK